jgi:hypothetical protein
MAGGELRGAAEGRGVAFVRERCPETARRRRTGDGRTVVGVRVRMRKRQRQTVEIDETHTSV